MYSSTWKIRKALKKNTYDNFKRYPELSSEVHFVYHLNDKDSIHIKALPASGLRDERDIRIKKKKLLPEDHPHFFQSLVAKALEKIRKRKQDRSLTALSAVTFTLGIVVAALLDIFPVFGLAPVLGVLLLPCLLFPAFIYGLKQIHHDSEKSRGRGFLLTASSGTLIGLGIGISLALLGLAIPGGIVIGACIGALGGLMLSTLIAAFVNIYTIKTTRPVDQSEKALAKMEVSLLPALKPLRQERIAFFEKDNHNKADFSSDDKNVLLYTQVPSKCYC